jgi:hypothetical protein
MVPLQGVVITTVVAGAERKDTSSHCSISPGFVSLSTLSGGRENRVIALSCNGCGVPHFSIEAAV